jgi:ferredoxin-NADP reductase/predicted pyridoxine 5'-phosphate oxidase superfamily flavin-nucleotide-binding protein
MAHKFAEIAFTPTIRDIQSAEGSREAYSRMDQGEDYNFLLSERESGFITARDSFYMASVSETGWPYVQHRGGPAGFVKILDERSLGFADYSGNRQYVSTGNITRDERVSLFFMDYPNRRRLKMLGRVRIVGPEESATLALLEDPEYAAQVERGFIIRVEAFDWNCPQHITPRYSEAEAALLLDEWRERIEPSAEQAPVTSRQNETGEPSPSAPEDAPEVLGEGPLELVVSGIRQLTPRVRAFEFRDPSGRDLPEVEPGSHLRIPVRLPDGELLERHYSIASNPARRDVYEIAVLREDVGVGGSRAVHDSYRLGTRVRVEPPANHFALHRDERPAELIAGGIGITPIKAMAQALEARGAAFQLHYAGRSRTDMAFRDRLERQLGSRMRVYSSEEGERLDIRERLSEAADDTVFYVCGPARLIGAVQAQARDLGIHRDRIRLELFS